MNKNDLISIILFFSFIASLSFYIIYGKMTEKKFNSISEKFSSTFGYIPFSMAVGKCGGFSFWGYKESYLICALIFTKLPVTKKILTPEEILFFKGLRGNEISWFYIKYSALAFGWLAFISLIIILKNQ